MDMQVELAPLTRREFDFRGIRGLSSEALELHRGLYEGYVKETNGLLAKLNEFPRSSALTPEDRLVRDGLVRRLSFERNGVVWHEMFFESLGSVAGKPAPGGVFAEALDISFGGVENWKKDLLDVAQTRGVGWVVTFRTDGDNRLINAWVDDHTRGILAGLRPIALFDLWEHAYLLDFKPSQRKEYMATLFDNMNWPAVEARCK
jgi:superoxide dismutase, Fe-Mn family